MGFEKDVEGDYTTEKLLNGLYNNGLTVYVGSSYARSIMPPNSYVDGLAFANATFLGI